MQVAYYREFPADTGSDQLAKMFGRLMDVDPSYNTDYKLPGYKISLAQTLINLANRQTPLEERNDNWSEDCASLRSIVEDY
jgi:hypothetical protein